MKILKANEERYIKKFRELVGDEEQFPSSSSEPNTTVENNENNFLQINDYNNTVLIQRDQEINSLINSLSSLSSIFKDMQLLVLEQGKYNLIFTKGTILDRIDYNIEVALDNTKKANTNLVEADKNLASNCSRNALMLIMFIIFVESILLLLKFIN